MNKDNINIEAADCFGNRNTETFKQVFLQYGQMVFRISARILGNATDAEDMVQSVFIKAWESFDRYNCQYSMATWLRTITCRMCYNTLRKKDSRYEACMTDVENIYENDTPETIRIWKESLRELHIATKCLPPKQRIIFIMRDIEGISAEETAKTTGLSAVQIKSNLYFARKKIKKQLETIFQQ